MTPPPPPLSVPPTARALLVAVVVLAFWVPGVLPAQTPPAEAEATDTRWHLFVPSLQRGGAWRPLPPRAGDVGTPTATAAPAEVSGGPDGSAVRRYGATADPDAPALPGAPARGTARMEREVELDQETDRVDGVPWAPDYRPSPHPHKRMAARGHLVEDLRTGPRIVPTPGLLRPAAVDPASGPGRAFFVGRFDLQLASEEPVPIPAPGGDMRVHQAESEPPSTLLFFQDPDDNWWVQAPGAPPVLRLTLLVSADERWFGGSLTVGRGARNPQGSMSLAMDVDRILAAAGARRDDRDDLLVERLTRYLQGFRPGDLPGDLPASRRLVSIGLGERGVCRHRAFVFFASLWSVGIPVRYVFNENHAFVEVRLGDHWRHIDLGGAPEPPGTDPTEDWEVYEGIEDPLAPPPEAGEEENTPDPTHAAGPGGEAPAEIEGWDGGPPAPAAGTGTVDPTEARAGSGPALPSTEPGGATEGGAGPPMPPAVQAVQGGTIEFGAPRVEDARCRVRLRLPTAVLLRGHPMPVEGQWDDAWGLPWREPLRLVLIDTAGGEGGTEYVLTEVAPTADGVWQGQVVVPADVPTGRWELRARWFNGAQWQLCESE